MVLTADEELAARVRSLRSHAMTSGTWDRHTGHEASYDVVDVGYNFRLDEPRAALGLARLPRLRDDIERRRAAVRRYREALAGTPGLTLMWTDDDVERSSHFAFPVLFESRGGAAARARRARTRSGSRRRATRRCTRSPSCAPLAAPGSLPRGGGGRRPPPRAAALLDPERRERRRRRERGARARVSAEAGAASAACPRSRPAPARSRRGGRCRASSRRAAAPRPARRRRAARSTRSGMSKRPSAGTCSTARGSTT